MTPVREIEVLNAAVNWHDNAANNPSVTFLLSRDPVWERYEKRPCVAETLSGEQTLVVGKRVTGSQKSWYIYYSEDDGFAWFFTWGGRPDSGFGRWRRTITLLDGTEEEVIGGWHVTARAAEDAGFPPLVDVAVRTNYLTIAEKQTLQGGSACFVTEERFRREVERLLPNCDVVRDEAFGFLTVKLRGQPTKAEFMRSERVRAEALRKELETKYGSDWREKATEGERSEAEWRSYSALRGANDGNSFN